MVYPVYSPDSSWVVGTRSRDGCLWVSLWRPLLFICLVSHSLPHRSVFAPAEPAMLVINWEGTLFAWVDFEEIIWAKRLRVNERWRLTRWRGIQELIASPLHSQVLLSAIALPWVTDVFLFFKGVVVHSQSEGSPSCFLFPSASRPKYTQRKALWWKLLCC